MRCDSCPIAPDARCIGDGAPPLCGRIDRREGGWREAAERVARGETDPAPPDPAPPADPDGPGSILKAFLADWGFAGCAACDEHAARMDALGADAVLADLDAQVAEIHGRARLVPEFVIRNRVEWACRESLRRKAGAPA